MTEARKKKSKIKVLGMSATPVINNLREGISSVARTAYDEKKWVRIENK